MRTHVAVFARRAAPLLLCAPLALSACGEGSGPAAKTEPPIAPALPTVPEASANELPANGSGELDANTDADNPFAVPEMGAALPPQTPDASLGAPDGPATTPEGELPTHDPDGVPYCD